MLRPIAPAKVARLRRLAARFVSPNATDTCTPICTSNIGVWTGPEGFNGLARATCSSVARLLCNGIFDGGHSPPKIPTASGAATLLMAESVLAGSQGANGMYRVIVKITAAPGKRAEQIKTTKKSASDMPGCLSKGCGQGFGGGEHSVARKVSRADWMLEVLRRLELWHIPESLQFIARRRLDRKKPRSVTLNCWNWLPAYRSTQDVRASQHDPNHRRELAPM